MKIEKSLRYSLVFFIVPTLFVVSIVPCVRADEIMLRTLTDCPPSTFNPLQAARDICQSVWFSGLLYEPLVLELFNGSLVPWLAKSWEILDNGTRYVFHLDERAKWSDGKPVTAHDVEVTWNLTWTYARPSLLVGVLEDVRAVDTYTVEFITNRTWFRWAADFGTRAILPAHIWINLTDPLSYDFINDPTKHITTSAFKYDSFETGQWWLFKKRPDYWKTESMPKIDGIL